jgi:hypothetical protein
MVTKGGVRMESRKSLFLVIRRYGPPLMILKNRWRKPDSNFVPLGISASPSWGTVRGNHMARPNGVCLWRDQ